MNFKLITNSLKLKLIKLVKIFKQLKMMIKNQK